MRAQMQRPPQPQAARMQTPKAAVETTSRPNQAAHQQSGLNAGVSRGQPTENAAFGQFPAPVSPSIPQNPDLSVGFVSGNTAKLLKQTDNPAGPRNIPAFNPHADSPSLRRTNGIEHRTSGPIRREDIAKMRTNAQNGQSVQQSENLPPALAVPRGPTADFGGGASKGGNNIGPDYARLQADSHRKIGMPSAAQSPLANRSAYKPPGPAAGLKRGPDGVPQQQGNRPPLIDVSNVAGASRGPGDATFGGGDGADLKRPRIGGG